MNNKDLLRLSELASSEIYQEIRKELLNFILKASNSTISPEKIQGMLILLNQPDIWIYEYEKALKNK